MLVRASSSRSVRAMLNSFRDATELVRKDRWVSSRGRMLSYVWCRRLSAFSASGVLSPTAALGHSATAACPYANRLCLIRALSAVPNTSWPLASCAAMAPSVRVVWSAVFT